MQLLQGSVEKLHTDTEQLARAELSAHVKVYIAQHFDLKLSQNTSKFDVLFTVAERL